jgi:hypothetical protein
MNNKDHLSLQNPDFMNNRQDSVSSVDETPNLNPNKIRPENTVIRTRKYSIEIPKWDTFDDTNNEIPTMDYSPMYATNSPESRSSKISPLKTEQQLQSQKPIRISKHEKINDTVSGGKPEGGLVRNIYNFFFG